MRLTCSSFGYLSMCSGIRAHSSLLIPGLAQTGAVWGLRFPAGRDESSRLRVRRLTETEGRKNQRSAPARLNGSLPRVFAGSRQNCCRVRKRSDSAMQGGNFLFFWQGFFGLCRAERRSARSGASAARPYAPLAEATRGPTRSTAPRVPRFLPSAPSSGTNRVCRFPITNPSSRPVSVKGVFRSLVVLSWAL
jgi:hypothetical protein